MLFLPRADTSQGRFAGVILMLAALGWPGGKSFLYPRLSSACILADQRKGVEGVGLTEMCLRVLYL